MTTDQVDEFLLDSQQDFEDGPKSVEGDRNNSNAKPTGSTCFGNPLNEINFGPSAWPILEPLKTTPTHSVLFKPRSPSGKPPFPFPDSFKDGIMSECLAPMGASILFIMKMVNHLSTDGL